MENHLLFQIENCKQIAYSLMNLKDFTTPSTLALMI